MSADQGALKRLFSAEFGRAPELVAAAPGRVNLIGEHTDYNEGFVLPIAIDRSVAVAATSREDGRVCVSALDLGEKDEFHTEALEPARGTGWQAYVRGVAWALREHGVSLRGADLAISGDVPPEAGLSSSAALEVAVAGALVAVSGQTVEPQDLALLCQRAENAFAGVQCGIMDQLAAVFGRAGHALLIDCRSFDVTPVPFEPADEMAIVVVDSGVARDLAQTAYNSRREECQEAARRLGIASLRDVSADWLKQHSARLPETLFRRAQHVVTENARVLAAAAALRERDLERVGRLMNESHESLRDGFEVSCPELDLLVEVARKSAGVLGSRLTGAGFGGCTVNLVRLDAIHVFCETTVEAYSAQTGLGAAMFVCRPSAGLRVQRV